MSKTVFVERSGNIGKRHEDMFLNHFLMFLTFISTYLPIYLYLPLVTFNVAVPRQDVVSRSMGFRRIQRLGDRSNRSQGRSE